MTTDTLAKRLQLAISRAGVTQAELAKQANLSQGAINKLVSGKAKSSKGLLAIALSLDVDPKWLQWGAGEMTPDPSTVEEREKQAIEHERKIERQRNMKYHDVEVPFLNGIEFVNGDGSYTGVNEDEPFKIMPKSLFDEAKLYPGSVNLICFPFRGDSMSPAIKDGSLVTINTRKKIIYDGSMYAINQDGWKRIRVLDRISPSKIRIRSYQPDKYPDEEAELESVEILGSIFIVTSIY
ncbi:XRE family transcriptional regulator [Xenorhabdus griffiniae]|uniref:XRE family transcriptional regulator n=1 Tax=Xenorhabdus griffiniae TaxID=351672 RepID=UPI0023592B78|nr:S24 family peptidase [Xenorhabdus griffiniae]MDC9606380.1 S24 family peptidase [Xenorhabdus griffiniae]